MFQDIIRVTIQKIFNDKILLGLLIVCLLGFFVGSFSNKNEPQVGKAPENQTATAPTTAPAGTGQLTKSLTNDDFLKTELEPSLAVDFVKWWMKMAMDYSPNSAAQSHEATINWMAPEALKAFNQVFWTPELAQQVTSGATVGAFQPISVRAVAINPDHTIVVNLTGTLVLQAANARPASNQVQMDLLIAKGKTGLRVTGISNHISSVSSSAY